MKKLSAILAFVLCFQINGVAIAATTSTTTTQNSSVFSKFGRILKIMTEDETTTVESEKSSLKKMSDFMEKLDADTDTVTNKSQTTVTELKELQTAIKNNDTATVKKLLSKNNVNTKYSDGTTSLSLAVLNDNAETIKLIAKAGGDLDQVSSNGESQVYVAASLGKINALKQLINSGADVNLANKQGLTPLHAAVTANKADSVTVLIKAGADVNATSNKGLTPLGLATLLKRTDIKTTLKNAGATYNL